MATIQVRNLPDDTDELIREQARTARQSIQASMRDQVIELARARERKARLLGEMRRLMATDRGIGVRPADVLADLDADRGR